MKVRVASPVSRPVRMSDSRRPPSVRSLSARRDALVRTTRAEVFRLMGKMGAALSVEDGQSDVRV